MIDATFIQKISEMAWPQYYADNEITYCDKPMKIIAPPSACSLPVGTLTAVVDYCSSELEKGRNYVLHIDSFRKVTLLSRLDEKYRSRESFVTANAFEFDFQFGKFFPVDEFIIALQAMFIQDETTAAILKLVGNMTSQSEVGTKDDGVTQRVEARSGLAKVENISVPNPVYLHPYRTFLEIGQPGSNFVLRMNANHQCALFESDGGAWKIEAVQMIKLWINTALKSAGVAEGIITILA